MTTKIVPADIAVVLKPVVRWTPSRKFWLLQAIREHFITPSDAMTLHGLTVEELSAWERGLNEQGVRGLAVGHAR